MWALLFIWECECLWFSWRVTTWILLMMFVVKTLPTVSIWMSFWQSEHFSCIFGLVSFPIDHILSCFDRNACTCEFFFRYNFLVFSHTKLWQHELQRENRLVSVSDGEIQEYLHVVVDELVMHQILLLRAWICNLNYCCSLRCKIDFWAIHLQTSIEKEEHEVGIAQSSLLYIHVFDFTICRNNFPSIFSGNLI